jgi:hypothetical protein
MSFRKDVYIKVGGWNPDLFQSDSKKIFAGRWGKWLMQKNKEIREENNIQALCSGISCDTGEKTFY